MKIYIKRIEYLGESQPSRRALKITLNNKTVIRVDRCWESWQQYGGTLSELAVTQPTVEAHNDWLHGGPRPI